MVIIMLVSQVEESLYHNYLLKTFIQLAPFKLFLIILLLGYILSTIKLTSQVMSCMVEKLLIID